MILIENLQKDIILHLCTINENHMMYGSWNIEHDKQAQKIYIHHAKIMNNK